MGRDRGGVGWGGVGKGVGGVVGKGEGLPAVDIVPNGVDGLNRMNKDVSREGLCGNGAQWCWHCVAQSLKSFLL